MRLIILPILYLLLTTVPALAQSEEILQCKGIQMLEQGYLDQAAAIGFRSDEHTNNYDINYHRLEWEIDPGRYYIKGVVTSFFTPKSEDFDQINFNLAEALQVNAVLYKGQSLNFQQTAEDIIEIYFPQTLPSNQLDSVTIDYEGAPPGDGLFAPFQRSTHGASNTPIIWTLSEPFGADNWWPCKQTLTDKIDSIDVYVRTPSQNRVASNGLLVEEIIDGNFTTYKWKHRYPIATYLVAVAVTNYRAYSDFVELMDGRQLEILNYVYPEYYDVARLTSPVTIGIMQLFEQLFGPYPFKEEKYGHAQFNFGGGIEHQTMSFMFNFGPGLVAHELAHQWFGDKVTCGSFNDIWVNEGFARYGEYLAHESGLTNTNARSWLANERDQVTSIPSGSVFIPEIFSEGRIFDFRLSYRKGGVILHMLRWKLGDEAFFQGLKKYLEDDELAFGFGIGEDVKDQMEQVSGEDLDEFFNDWYYGQGYPTYTLMWSQDNNRQLTITVEQETSSPVVDFFEMPLPVKVSGKDQEQMVVLDHQFSGQSFTVDIPFEVTAIEFDPDLKILSRDNSVVFTTSNEERELAKQQIFLSPNPVRDRLYLQTRDLHIPVSDVQIIHNSGQLIRQLRLDGVTNSISVADLPAGLYFLKIKTGNTFLVKKFVKE